MKQAIKVLVEANEGAYIYNFTTPTKLGEFLELAPNYLVLNGEELAWVRQVEENLKNGYSYVKAAR